MGGIECDRTRLHVLAYVLSRSLALKAEQLTRQASGNESHTRCVNPVFYSCVAALPTGPMFGQFGHFTV